VKCYCYWEMHRSVQNSCKQTCGCILIWGNNNGWNFSLQEWIMYSHFGQKWWIKVKMPEWWICFLQAHSFSLQITDWLESCWLLVDYWEIFISCLDSHSDGTHLQTHLHLGWPEGEKCSANFHFCLNYSFNMSPWQTAHYNFWNRETCLYTA